MKNKTSRNLRAVLNSLLIFLLLLSLAALPADVHAQEPDHPPQLVTLYAESDCGGVVWPLTMQVWNVGSDGGAAYAEAKQIGQSCVNGKLQDAVGAPGTFTGGPDGVLTLYFCLRDQPTNCKTVTYQLVDGRELYYEGARTGYIVQNPEAFESWRSVQVTPEYIFNTYGIKVQDSFNDPPFETAEWTQQELNWMNDMLKELPKSMLEKMSLNRIVRNKVQIDDQGNPRPSVGGTYYPCGSPPEKDCGPEVATIRIFNGAASPSSFPGDVDGSKFFKSIILHEMIHAMQYQKDKTSIYRNAYDSPLMQNYMDATRNITNIYDPGFNEQGNGWIWGSYPNQQPKYHLWQPPADNSPPDEYGKINPKEDMCDSVMWYMYDPQRLKAVSIKRYNAIRDLIFEGVEYENGVQKKP